MDNINTLNAGHDYYLDDMMTITLRFLSMILIIPDTIKE